MCVIAISDDVRPTDEQVGKMFEANKYGAGIAWREKGVVRWKKGMGLEEVTELCQKVPLPFVVHFRIPSAGGDSKYLCHPFPVTADVPLELQGTTKGYVLFHNGHWNRWKESTLEAAVRSGTKVPGGKWSDTRAMAFHAHIYGSGILEMIDEKSVLFGPTKVEVFGQWSKEGGLWVSNRGWTSQTFRRGGNTDIDYAGWHGHVPPSSAHRQLSAGPEVEDGEVAAEDAHQTAVSGNAHTVMGPVPLRQVKGRTAPRVPEGVDLDTLPFEQITAMFERQEISKKQWKKHRNRYEVALRQASRVGRKRNKRQVH